MVPPQDELQSLLIKELRNVGVAPGKEALIQGIEQTLAATFEFGFRFGNTGIMSAFFHFLEMDMNRMSHERYLDSILTKNFDRLL